MMLLPELIEDTPKWQRYYFISNYHNSFKEQSADVVHIGAVNLYSHLVSVECMRLLFCCVVSFEKHRVSHSVCFINADKKDSLDGDRARFMTS